jgi:hypothetical protein
LVLTGKEGRLAPPEHPQGRDRRGRTPVWLPTFPTPTPAGGQGVTSRCPVALRSLPRAWSKTTYQAREDARNHSGTLFRINHESLPRYPPRKGHRRQATGFEAAGPPNMPAGQGGYTCYLARCSRCRDPCMRDYQLYCERQASFLPFLIFSAVYRSRIGLALYGQAPSGLGLHSHLQMLKFL